MKLLSALFSLPKEIKTLQTEIEVLQQMSLKTEKINTQILQTKSFMTGVSAGINTLSTTFQPND